MVHERNMICITHKSLYTASYHIPYAEYRSLPALSKFQLSSTKIQLFPIKNKCPIVIFYNLFDQCLTKNSFEIHILVKHFRSLYL